MSRESRAPDQPMAARAATRRERYRHDTLEEAKRLAFTQLADRGPGGLSLNAIAREMGMTGPALYRYVGSRDDLITKLVLDTYHDLGDALWRAVRQSEGQPPPARVRAVGLAYRERSVANTQHYLLILHLHLHLNATTGATPRPDRPARSPGSRRLPRPYRPRR